MMRDHVQVRAIQREDLADMRKYFFESTPEFLNGIGLKTPQSGDAEAFQTRWDQRFADRESSGCPIPSLTVLYDGMRVGIHTSTHQEPGKSLIMHAHFFRADLRGRGIGTVSYVLAIEKFLTEYGFQEVIFKTPLRNLAAIKIKEKLGLIAIGEEIIDWPVLIEPQPTKVFRVTLAELPGLKKRAGI